MYGSEKSDGRVVPEKPANNAWGAPQAAERVEERRPTEGNLVRDSCGRTQRRVSGSKRDLARCEVLQKAGSCPSRLVEPALDLT